MTSQFSKATSSALDGSRINDSVRLVLSELGPDRGRTTSAENPLPQAAFRVDQEVVRCAFDQAKGEFQRVLGPTRRGTRLAFGAVLGSLAIAISGSAVLFLTLGG